MLKKDLEGKSSWKELANTFVLIDLEQTTSKKLKNLRQKGTFSEYSAEFHHLNGQVVS